MAPYIGQNNADAAVEDWESQLVAHAVSLQSKYRPSWKPAELVEELLARLRAEKAVRESRNLNHWADHAPRFVAGVLGQARQSYLQRRRDVRNLLRTRHAAIVRVLESVVHDPAAAEAIVSDTYKELIEGRTSLRYFPNAALANARNYLKSRKLDHERFLPLDAADGALSQRPDDQDPLGILIQQEEQQETAALVIAAMKDPRWRYIKRLTWAKRLLGKRACVRRLSPRSCAKSASSAE